MFMSSAIVSCVINPMVDPPESIVQIFSEHGVLVSRWLVQESDGERSEQLLIGSTDGIGIAKPLSKKLVADLNLHLPGQVSIVVKETQGFARVRSEDGSSQNGFHVAASVAVMKASWVWDESRPIVVHLDDDEFDIYPRFDGQAWIASDHP